MATWKPAMKRIWAVAAAMSLAAAAFSYAFFDPDIKILKTSGSPTIGVQYSGAHAARIEMKINGTSIGTKDLNSKKTNGLIPFTVAIEKLQQGDNLVEVFLYDEAGNVLGTERSTMFAQKGERQPVFIKLPKMGQTVQGTVEMTVGFGMDMRETYVSFFVDSQFRSMRNFPPYNYFWDTTKETNGWHQLEAWTFDQSQATRKSQPVRVYVDNPGGRTERSTQTGDLTLSSPNSAPTSAPQGMKATGTANAMSASGAATVVTPPLIGNRNSMPMGKKAGMKGPAGVYAEVTGFRVSIPKPTKAAKNATPKTSATVVKIVPGTKLTKTGTFDVYLDGNQIKFDVSPRVAEGVPLTPFRHLFEGAGGKVDWQNIDKVCTAFGVGSEVWIKIGDLYAKVNGKSYQLDYVPFLERGRTIVPLSFINGALSFKVEYDAKTNHVLITKNK